MEDNTIYSEMWNAYRGVILHSIVTSFGLDFLVKDQDGGDVDTIRGVRETGIYKNKDNALAYENRGIYDSVPYHRHDGYVNMVREARNSQAFFEDAYKPGNSIYYGKSSALGTEGKANLDHVIPTKVIHDDKGRVLAGVDGVELANQKTNLQFTNEHLNKSKGDMTVEEYIQWNEDKGHPLPDAVVEQMRDVDSEAHQAYEQCLAEAYYSSKQFLKDAGASALNRGLEMGIRQALGFIFIEIWIACEDELKSLPSDVELFDCFKAIESGIEKGISNAFKKYDFLLLHFEQGFKAGLLASLSTTLINIFVTTEKNKVRYIRQASMTVVQVGDILFFNPDDLRLGDQLKEAMVVLTTGASVLVGTAVGNQIAKTPLGQHAEVGYVLQNFCSALVGGLISCTLLILVDRSKFINEVVLKLNEYGTTDASMRETSEAFERIAAEVGHYDIEEFKEDLRAFSQNAELIENATDEELDDVLMDIYNNLNITLPWEGDFDEFMSDKNNRLVYN